MPIECCPTIREGHLQCLDVFKLVSVPLLDLSVLSRSEEQMGFRDKLKKHDTREERQQGKNSG